ncbi:MAG: hypothetical protein PVH55_06375 [Desulfobacterales bacterium]|jgi:hypothetical protein
MKHMPKLKPISGEMNNVSEYHLFASRLKLLIIMAKAYLNGCPLGNHRKQAILENANQVFYHSLRWISESAALKNHGLDTQTHSFSTLEPFEENIFHKRVQLLAVIATTMVGDRPMNQFRKKTLADNLSKICETLAFTFKINDINFLKVA